MPQSRDRAIVVSFSTWLPDSQETLTSDLLADRANECQKQYVVPGLQKSTRRLANALSQTVPILKGALEFFPVATQRDDIENLRQAPARLPKRVVVLLDELDRMERDELLTLLKVIRGISALPNLSFVCAADRKRITEIAQGKRMIKAISSLRSFSHPLSRCRDSTQRRYSTLASND